MTVTRQQLGKLTQGQPERSWDSGPVSKGILQALGAAAAGISVSTIHALSSEICINGTQFSQVLERRVIKVGYYCLLFLLDFQMDIKKSFHLTLGPWPQER